MAVKTKQLAVDSQKANHADQSELFKQDLEQRIVDVADSRHRKQMSQVITNK